MDNTKVVKKIYRFSINEDTQCQVLGQTTDDALVTLLKKLIQEDAQELYNDGYLNIDLEDEEVEIPTEDNPVVFLDNR